MRSLGLRYTAAALTFAISLGVNIDYNQVDQLNSGSWLGAGLALSGAQARGHGGGHHGGGGGHHGGGGGHHGGGGGHHGGGGGHHGGGGHNGGGHHGGDDHHHHDGYDHDHHHNRAAWRALGAAAFLATLPRGCPLVGLYYYCGGVYYQSVVQDGSTVYIVVTP